MEKASKRTPTDQEQWAIDFSQIDFSECGIDYQIFRQWDDPDDYQYIDQVSLYNIDIAAIAGWIITCQYHPEQHSTVALGRDLISDDQQVMIAILRACALDEDSFIARIEPGYYGDEFAGAYLDSMHNDKITQLWGEYLDQTTGQGSFDRQRWLQEHGLSN